MASKNIYLLRDCETYNYLTLLELVNVNLKLLTNLAKKSTSKRLTGFRIVPL